jgi:5-methylcytosine-specific restriction protein A
MESFDNDDGGFMAWMKQNPDGFVINSGRTPRSAYAMYHKANCTHLSFLRPWQLQGGFTRQYIKVCSNNLQELLTWRMQHRSRAQDIYCQTCAPCPINAVISYPDEVDDATTYHEGAITVVHVNAYERNLTARQRCLDHWGLACRVCGMTFREQYGELGDGFIHVHHLRPLSTIGEEYEVNPIEDLCPICPNCHAMIHKDRRKPLSIQELKAHLQRPPR